MTTPEQQPTQPAETDALNGHGLTEEWSAALDRITESTNAGLQENPRTVLEALSPAMRDPEGYLETIRLERTRVDAAATNLVRALRQQNLLGSVEVAGEVLQVNQES